jgi:YebC/PmpR family DNA-binding regulatory protein
MGRAFEYRKAAKMARWGNMSRVFPKLGRTITMAAKEGGTDPEMNAKLRSAILNAKAQNMPKDNIEAAIKRANGKDAANYSEVNYEGKGPHGVLIFIECTTDNSTRTVANIKSLFTKASGALVPTGSLEFMFSRKAVFEVKKTPELDMDELELGLIEAGLESTESDEDTLYIYGDYTNFGSLSSAIADMGLEITKAGLERIANDPKDFTDEQAADIQKLIDKIEDDDDVQAVYTNIA